MKKYLEILKTCTLFDGIAEDDVLRVLTCFGARVTAFDKKYTIFAEGTPNRYIGILLSGSAQMTQLDFYGNRTVLSDIRAPEVFAAAFACAEVDVLPVSVIAEEACEVMLIDSAHLLHTCQNSCAFHRQIIYNLMKDLALKTIQLHKRIEVTSKRTTREKLLTYLTLQAKRNGSSSFDIPFDRQELADYLEVDRSGLSAEIGKLKKQGLIDNHKNHFILL